MDSSPAVAGGVVYVGSDDDNVYALNATTGAQVWSYTTGNLVNSSPAVAGGIVYVDLEDFSVYAFGVGVHDVAVTNVACSKTVVGQGFSANITVTVANEGDYTEAFNVTAYANITAIQTETLTLTSQNSTTLTFTWNATGFAKGNYTISAYAWPVPGETNTANNNFTDGWVIISIAGDIAGKNGLPDGKVDMKDIATVAAAFGSTPSSSNWNSNCDLNNDLKVDMKDIAIVAANFGNTDP